MRENKIVLRPGSFVAWELHLEKWGYLFATSISSSSFEPSTKPVYINIILCNKLQSQKHIHFFSAQVVLGFVGILDFICFRSQSKCLLSEEQESSITILHNNILAKISCDRLTQLNTRFTGMHMIGWLQNYELSENFTVKPGSLFTPTTSVKWR